MNRCLISEVLVPSVFSDIEELYLSEEYPIDLAKRIAAQMARGLEYLRHCGVVHRGRCLPTYQRSTDLYIVQPRSSSQEYLFFYSP